jgi:hypothetical protein
MKLLLNPKQNLHIDLEKNMVISYRTVVADIKGDRLVSRGKFSRTTSKHISHACWLLGLQLTHNTNRVVTFGWLDYGVNVKVNNSLSPKNSEKFLELLKEFGDKSMALVGTYLEVGAKSSQKPLIAGELARLGVDIEETAALIKLIRKHGERII